jgi:5-methylcytosine-specific restriction endonuclease McrA
MATSVQYDHATLCAIWFKGQTVLGYDGNVFRKDAYGSWIKWDEYGQNSTYGWHVDHIIPIARRGPHHLGNWRPLHWQNNLRKADNPR